MKQRIISRLRNKTGIFLQNMERRIRDKSQTPSQPQFFITGLPRTGTTLIYQYILHRLHMAYFPYFSGEYYRMPCIAARFSRLIFPPYRSDFQSKFGKVKGPMAPREAGAFWLRFFHIDAVVEPGSLFSTGFSDPGLFSFEDKEKLEILQKTIFAMQSIFGGAPFINKNVKHMQRIQVLKTLFPSCIFMVIDRDMEDVALSLLDARKKKFGDPNTWWSVRPPSYEQLKTKPYLEQVAYQVYDCHRMLEEDLGQLSQDCVIRVNYKEFCENPEAVIREIKEICPGVKYKHPAVKGFDYKKREIKTDEEKELAGKTRELFGPTHK